MVKQDRFGPERPKMVELHSHIEALEGELTILKIAEVSY